jgi:hypothetical protein
MWVEGSLFYQLCWLRQMQAGFCMLTRMVHVLPEWLENFTSAA